MKPAPGVEFPKNPNSLRYMVIYWEKPQPW